MSQQLMNKREGIKRGIYLLPNLLTTANLFCGFFAMVRAINEDYLTAAWMIVLAGFFDFMDGRVARLTKTQSEFGLEYDSLVDMSSFGLATSLLMYKWGLFNFGRFGWAACFVFFACAGLRLARFNVQSGGLEKKNFQGLPVPAAAGFLVSYVIIYHHLIGSGVIKSYFVLFMTFFLAALMVSNVPYRSFKFLDAKKRANFFLLVLAIGFVFLMATAPQIMLFVCGVVYVGLGLVEMILKTPQKIKNFRDFMVNYFQADPNQLLMDEKEDDITDVSLKVVGGNIRPENRDKENTN